MIWYNDNFSPKDANLANLCTLKNYIYSIIIHKKMSYIGPTINIFNNTLQKISLKFSFTWKSEKDSKMIMNPIFGPWSQKNFVFNGTKQILKVL
jgi:hypothetical protein